MGKRVFEVAKDLGVDHRELLERCDSLSIDVRNYMSVLNDDDEQALRGSFTTAKKVVEQVQAPGVVRRRRRVAPAEATSRPGVLRVRRSVEPTATPELAPKPAVVVKPEPVEVAASVVEEAVVPETPVVTEAAAPAVEAESAPETTPVEPAVKVASETKQSDAESGSDEKPSEAKPETAQPLLAVAPAVAVAKPAANTPGAARVLGSIPLEQLQRRTVRPQPRTVRGAPPRQRSGGPGRPGGPGGPGGPGRQDHQDKSGPGGAARSSVSPSEVPLPPSEQSRRRSRLGGAPGGNEDADRKERAQAQGRRRRQVVSREDLYNNSGRNMRNRRRKVASKKGAKTQLTTPAAHKRVVHIDDTISAGELAKSMGIKANEVIQRLIGLGTMATINEQIDVETATLIASEFEFEVKNTAFDESNVLSSAFELSETEEEVDPDAVLRAPVVTIMGHVDHGKTTLLDRIREANVAGGEAGGITQHIGAYRVSSSGGDIVFLDTPGHAAFTSMRARGASVTDIVVLIVAADDGVMPQTEESINHARAAGVPIVVAVNKVDKPDVDPERIKQELTQFELVPEEWGGETMVFPVSALTGQGVPELLEGLALQAEVLELHANPSKPAYGRVVEARVDKGRGNVCTVLVQEGTLRKSDFMVCGAHFGRVRALMDDHGNTIAEAGPSTPVEVLGLGGMPLAGDAFQLVKNEKDARRVVAARVEKTRLEALKERQAAAAEDPFAALDAPAKETQNIILKADVAGSFEALKASLLDLSTDEVEVRLLHGGVGSITESDVDLANASDAVIFGFNTEIDGKAKRLAEREAVRVVCDSIIYVLLDTAKALMSGLLSPEVVEEYVGRAEVRAIFHIQRIGSVAGCFVVDGKMVRNAKAKVLRGDDVVIEGKLSMLKRFKDDVKEVANGYECGIFVDGYKEITEGDLIEVFEVKEIERQID
jgi:translation initiation factor IF-2